MNRNNSGQIRIIEAFLAVIIVFSAFAVSANLTVTRNGTKSNDLSAVGLQTLTTLDSDGSLDKYISNGNWSALRDALDLSLPTGVSFNMTVYNGQMQKVNPVVIANGGFSSQDVAFVEYVCATRSLAFSCYIIHLYLAVAT